MRILLVGDYPRDERLGSTKVLLKLQAEFRQLGHTCDALLADDLGARPRHRVLRWTLAPVLALRAVRRAVRTTGPYDVIDAAGAEALWIAAARRAGAFHGTVVVARSNGLEHLNYRNMLADDRAGLRRKRWWQRIAYPTLRMSQVAAAARLANRFIVLNETDRAFALARGWKRPADIVLVPHGVSSSFLADSPSPDQPRGKGLLFCGTWVDVKGVRYLADALALLVARGVDVALTVLGGAVPADDIRREFSTAARGRVTIVERAEERQVIAAYRSHDVLVFPSTYEGFGMVVLEAMTQRLPVIATPVGCAASLIRDGQTGVVVPLRDAGALADAIERLLRAADVRARLAEAAWQRARAMSWTETARATLAVYEHARTAAVFAHA